MYSWGNPLPMSLKEFDQLRQVVNVGKANAPLEQQYLQRLFGGLLGLEAKVFSVDSRFLAFCLNEIAFWTVQPLSGVIWGESFRNHIRPFPLAGLAQ